MRFHVVGLPHTETNFEHLTCAYTQKVVKFCEMMLDRGHEVFLYSAENNIARCTEHVTVLSSTDQLRFFGPHDKAALPAVDWDPNSEYWRIMNTNTINGIRERKQERDIICLIAGTAQRPIASALPELLSVEYGIGYSGVFSDYLVFESYAWMHHIYGLRGDDNGHFYHDVVPNYFDVKQFTPVAKPKGDYLLWMGRMIARKGPNIAAEIAERAGIPLVMAGNGLIKQDGDEFIANDITFKSGNATHVGPVGVEERAELMANAYALLMPTLYLEPFGGVHVEAMLSGTPVITPDYGVFPETNLNGVTGFRFHTLREAVRGVERIEELNRAAIRTYAVNRFGLGPVGRQFETYFERLLGLYGDGWYEK